MTFRPDSRTDSVVITLLDDDLNEGLEEFTLQLVLTDEQLGMPDVLRESTVRIFDDEGVYVQARVHDLQVACISSMVCISDTVHVVLLVVIFWYVYQGKPVILGLMYGYKECMKFHACMPQLII